MPALDRNVKYSCENCGTLVTKKNLSRHKSRCSDGTLYCPKCPNFSTKSRDDLNYHIAKQHSAAGPSNTYKCTLCHAEFPGFYALRQHKNTQHGTQIGFEAREVSEGMKVSEGMNRLGLNNISSKKNGDRNLDRLNKSLNNRKYNKNKGIKTKIYN